MKKFGWVAIAAAGLLGACHPVSEGYTIHGTLTGEHVDGKVYLECLDSLNNPVTVDSTEMKEGKFVLSGAVSAPSMHYLVIDTNRPGEKADLRNRKFRAMFYLDNSDISFSGDVATLPGYYYSTTRKTVAPAVTGSPTHDLFLQMNAGLKPLTDTLSAVNERYLNEYYVPELEGKEVDESVGKALVREERKWNDRLLQAKLDFIKGNARSVVALDQAIVLFSDPNMSFTSAQMDELLGWFEPYWKGTSEWERLERTATSVRWMAIGEKYKDVEVLDRNGQTVRLSSLIPEGEYVMLEFWASWCGPCRAEIPHLRKVHEKYKDFAIVSISVDEKDSEWQKALKEEKMDWTQGRMEGGIYGEAAQQYHIMSVPMCLILDKEGRFYKSNVRGAYLDAFLEDLYAGKL